MDIERFTDLADRLCERIPERLLTGLNGGIVIDEAARRNDGDPAGVYILGEYITDDYLGAYVTLYYGSFVQLFGQEPDQVWESELWTTIRHELRHHLERQAGVTDLDVEDLMDLERFRQEERWARQQERLRRLALRYRRRATDAGPRGG